MHAIVIIPVYQPETVLPIVWLILWPIFFFNLGWQLFAVVWILLVWYLVWLLIKEFAQIGQEAARLLIPYLIWLTFAAYLNKVIALHR